MDWPASRDNDIADLIDDVQAELEDLTNRSWALVAGVEHTVKLEKFQRVIVLPCRPLTSVEVIGWVWSDSPPADYSDPLVEDTDYIVDLTTGKVELFEATSEKYEHIRIRYSGGFNETSCPRAARQAMIAQIQYQAVRESESNIAAATQVVEKSSARLREGDHHPRFKRFCMRNKRRS